jgi:hypothetical protein
MQLTEVMKMLIAHLAELVRRDGAELVVTPMRTDRGVKWTFQVRNAAAPENESQQQSDVCLHRLVLMQALLAEATGTGLQEATSDRQDPRLKPWLAHYADRRDAFEKNLATRESLEDAIRTPLSAFASSGPQPVAVPTSQTEHTKRTN